MEFDQLLKERYSVRKFSNQKVEKEKIDKISNNSRYHNRVNTSKKLTAP